jgi:hypothetical protein
MMIFRSRTSFFIARDERAERGAHKATSASAPELTGSERVPSLIVSSTPSPRHRPPTLRSLGEGRRRRDGATGTMGTVFLGEHGAQNAC